MSQSNLIKGAIRSCGYLAAEVQSKNGKIAAKNASDNFCVEKTNIKNLTSKIPEHNTSGIKGVTWDKERQKWIAQICFKGKITIWADTAVRKLRQKSGNWQKEKYLEIF